MAKTYFFDKYTMEQYLFSDCPMLQTIPTFLLTKQEEQMETSTTVMVREEFDAPEARSVKAIKEWMIARGAKGIIGHSAVAKIVGITKRTVKNAEYAGALAPIDRNTYTLDAVASWLYANPRLLAQSIPRYQLTEETPGRVREVLQKTAPRLLELFNNDIEELTMEICCRLSKRKPRGEVTELTLIYEEIRNLYKSKSVRQMANTVSIETVRGRVNNAVR